LGRNIMPKDFLRCWQKVLQLKNQLAQLKAKANSYFEVL